MCWVWDSESHSRNVSRPIYNFSPTFRVDISLVSPRTVPSLQVAYLTHRCCPDANTSFFYLFTRNQAKLLSNFKFPVYSKMHFITAWHAYAVKFPLFCAIFTSELQQTLNNLNHWVMHPVARVSTNICRNHRRIFCITNHLKMTTNRGRNM
jgi:hypothetical protein